MFKYLTCNYSIIIAIAFLTEIALSTKVAAQDKAINITVTEVLEASTHARDLLIVPEQSATQPNSLENFDTFNLAVQNSLDFWQNEPDYLEFLEFDATTTISFPENQIAQSTDDNKVVQATPETDEVTPDSPKEANRDNIKPPSVLSEPTEPSNQIVEIRQRNQERDALIPISPLGFVRKATDGATDAIYDAVKLDLGLSFSHAFQWLTDSLPDQDQWGTATDMDFIARWDILNAEKPSRGSFLFHLEGRWEYETTGPQNLGFVNLGSAIDTANTFSAYDPTFLVRNFYNIQSTSWSPSSFERATNI